ncbi:hypothetical protein [Chitinophaga caseinilytica]|uniref:Uncharacterized protein n=1 Tax=Chitinophaga caseinilytica TaxID=2267521 RepID=A0ABZ2Z067_9BACT
MENQELLITIFEKIKDLSVQFQSELTASNGEVKSELQHVRTGLETVKLEMKEHFDRIESEFGSLSGRMIALEENFVALLTNFNMHQYKQGVAYQEFKAYFERILCRIDNLECNQAEVNNRLNNLESAQAETNRRLEVLGETVKEQHISIAELRVVK